MTFNNTLKRGALQVRKSAEDNFIEGVTFHLHGTSASGLEVDEYAVTGADGVAHFENVLISGNTPYTIEEVDTAERYVVPENQTVSILWDDVAERSFHNVLKKFSVTVTKTDAETALEQGFHQFWAAYPNKKSKNDAKKVWFKLKPDKVLLARILDAVDKQSGTEQWQKENRKFVPYPAKWLRGGCWDDEVEVNTRERYERLDGGEGFIAPDTSNW